MEQVPRTMILIRWKKMLIRRRRNQEIVRRAHVGEGEVKKKIVEEEGCSSCYRVKRGSKKDSKHANC